MPKQEGAQEKLAEERLLIDDLANLGDGHPQYASRGTRHCCQKGSLPRQEADLAEKLSRLVGSDGWVLRSSCLGDDRDLALEQDNQVIALVALGEQHLAGGDFLL